MPIAHAPRSSRLRHAVLRQPNARLRAYKKRTFVDSRLPVLRCSAFAHVCAAVSRCVVMKTIYNATLWVQAPDRAPRCRYAPYRERVKCAIATPRVRLAQFLLAVVGGWYRRLEVSRPPPR